MSANQRFETDAQKARSSTARWAESGACANCEQEICKYMTEIRNWIVVGATGALLLLSFAQAGAADTKKQCEPQGIGAEEVFARNACNAATKLGIHPHLVHSYGAGGIDVFISEGEGAPLRGDRSNLTQLMTKLTDLAKDNYKSFNAIEVTLVAGNSKIAKGQKIGTGVTKVTIY